MADLKLTDLISVNILQEIQDGFAAVTGMAALTTDENGNPVTNGSNFTEFCMDLTRKCPEGCRRCEVCDRQGGEKTMSTGRAAAYSCHAGLVDFAAPIMVNGRMIGSFIGGQVLTSKPDEMNFRRTARELGIDEDRYVRAVKKVKILEKRQIDAAADFLCTIAGLLSQSAYENYVAKENNADLSKLSGRIFDKVKEARDGIAAAEGCINDLSEAFDILAEISANSYGEVEKTNGVIKQIQDIALNTKILGFNASIEASRAKESGKGFGVIAQEVRTLAETSKTSADNIQNSMKSIKNYTDDINGNIDRTRDIIRQCLGELEKLEVHLDEIRDMHNDM